MKSFILFIFVVGIILLTTGYQKQLARQIEVQKEIEYRFIPRSIYEEQMGQPDVSSSFADVASGIKIICCLAVSFCHIPDA